MAAERSPILSEVRATLGIAAPLAAANLAQMAMGITNTIMVGELGAAPLAAAGLGGMLFYMMAMLCQGVLSAVAPLAAHAIGADDHPTAGRVAGAGLIVAAALALPIVAILTAIPLLLALLGYEPALATEIGLPADDPLGRAGVSRVCGISVSAGRLVSNAHRDARAALRDPGQRGAQLGADLRAFRTARFRQRRFRLLDGHRAMADAALAGRLHAEDTDADAGQAGGARLVRDPAPLAARSADWRPPRPRSRRVRHDRHLDGTDGR